MYLRFFVRSVSSLLILCVLVSSAFTQQVSPTENQSFAANVIVPQSRSFNFRGAVAEGVQIGEITANINIIEQVATTKLVISLTNPSNRQQEAELILPVPDGAAVRGFDFVGASKESTAKLLPKAEAKAIYQSIVSKQRDPALLEFIGYNLIRSSVFPVPAKGKQQVSLIYENILPADGDRVDYVLPRSDSFESTATPWKITTNIRTKKPLATIYSPTHEITSERTNVNQAKATVSGNGGKMEPGAFRLSFLTEQNGITASLMAYPDPTIGGGYFLLLAGVPADARREKELGIKREVTIVLDRSGSMEGEKFKQAQAAALQIVSGLEDGESFNIIDYSDSVSAFAANPVVKTGQSAADARKYLKGLKANGGTNIKDALVEALKQNPMERSLPLVLFLTDGLPTVGERRETAIRSMTKEANTFRRRIFTFGVGYDVNAPLLTALANESRSASTFVLPNEDVEVKVSQVFRRLTGPVLAEPVLTTLDSSNAIDTQKVRELQPVELNDVFEGDQIVLLGQYRGDGELKFRIQGNYLGEQKTFQFEFDLSKSTTRNSFVPRLWANRKIARLIDQISQAGADNSTASIGSPQRNMPMSSAAIPPTNISTPIDPKIKELVDEIVRLSTEFGILTEYTSFLAMDGTDFSNREEINRQATDNFVGRAQQTRTGMAGVNQQVNIGAQSSQVSMNRSNVFLNSQMQRVEITNVQQIQDRTFFRRENRWVDARLLERGKEIKPDKTIEFGTKEFDAFVEQLVKEGRQSLLALKTDLLLLQDSKVILVKMPKQETK